MRIWILLVIAFAGLAARAGEPPAPVYAYELDGQTDLLLEMLFTAPITWQIELRKFGTAEEGQVFDFWKVLVGSAPGQFMYKSADRPETVQIIGTPSEPKLKVTAQNLALESGAPVSFDGEYRLLSPAERLKRARERWEKADAVLQATYARVRAEVGKSGEAKLRDLQRRRLALRDDRALRAVKRGVGKPQNSPDYYDEMLDYTTDHLQLLKIYTGRDVPKGLTGFYRDAVGGTLTLEETPAGLKFALHLIRRRTLANGDMTGVAELKGDRATFKSVLGDQQKANGQQPAEVVFTMRDGHLVHVESKHTEPFHEEGAKFDGDYFKAGPLPKPAE